MKKLLLLLFISCTLGAFAQNRTRNFPKYTLSEFYKMIQAEESDTFTLKNANIIYDTIADREYLLKKLSLQDMVSTRVDSIEVNKALVLENVFMQGVASDDTFATALNKVIFRKPVSIKNSEIWFYDNHFLSEVSLTYDDTYYEGAKENFENEREYCLILFTRCVFESDPVIRALTAEEEKLPISVWFDSSVFKGGKELGVTRWALNGANFIHLENNTFFNQRSNYIYISGNAGRIINNDFGERIIEFIIGDDGVVNLSFRENKINQKFFLRLPETIQNVQMDWSQFTSGVVGSSNYTDFVVNTTGANSLLDLEQGFRNPNNMRRYIDSARIVDNIYYKSEIGLLGTLNAIYKRQHDMESASASYIALKDLETQRLEYLYAQNPSFNTYFEWKVNQFLKLFSDYGTRPAKAITFSVYVILLFALIYLFFPNHWDSHGKNRIMDRYRFFLKYVNKNSGIHEVYLDEKKPELLHAEDFKAYLQQQGKTAPRFFTATAMPLYRWSVAGTKSFSWLLSKIDILKGTWSETSPAKQKWKSVLIFGAFFFAIVYDLFIKMLNALMLSINTFTTLGFGEIPIKGLPRYLAIVQGFIGWFMLTIFSVSLISQLLN